MPTILIDTLIVAPAARCFDLARHVEVHLDSTAHTGETAVGGVTTRLLGLGDEVTWSGRHLGVRQRLTSRITRYDRPRHFRDAMVRGAFARFDHDHLFEPTEQGTRMRDVFDYDAPLGVLGRIAERVLLTAYLDRLLRRRGEIIKQVAESEEWRRYLGDDGGR